MNIPRRAKITIFIIILSIIFVVVPIVIFLNGGSNVTDNSKTTGDKVVIIDNQKSYSSGVSQDTFNSISSSAYQAMTFNFSKPDTYYHGVIRKDTFKKSDTTISFMLDIPSASISWSVYQTIDSTGGPISDPTVKCVGKDEAIYALPSQCLDRSSADLTTGQTAEQNKFLGIMKSLPLAGQSYYITYGNSPTKPGEYALFVKFYTKTGSQDARAALITLGYNPADYEIIYTDSTK